MDTKIVPMPTIGRALPPFDQARQTDRKDERAGGKLPRTKRRAAPPALDDAVHVELPEKGDGKGPTQLRLPSDEQQKPEQGDENRTSARLMLNQSSR